MSQQKKIKQLSKFMTYVLGRQPDEFGLVPNRDGFVKIKKLLKAVSEENGWKHVRRHHLNEIPLTLINPPIEIRENLIRATQRDKLPKRTVAENPPRLLYTCVRRRAYPAVIDKGVLGMSKDHIILAATQAMAEKMGRRIDAMPVLLTVHVRKALDLGGVFLKFGRSLYLSMPIPVSCFSGPPPKQKPDVLKDPRPDKSEAKKTAGSYHVDPVGLGTANLPPHFKKKKKEISWKKNRKHINKQKTWPV